MGRLKRKKTTSKKKKDNGAAVQADNKAAPAHRPPAAAAPAAPSKKGKVVLFNRAAGNNAKQVTGKQSKNIIDKSLQFLREVKVELKKVTWPSRKQTIGSTVVVIILVMIISLFLGIVDFGLSSFIRVIL